MFIRVTRSLHATHAYKHLLLYDTHAWFTTRCTDSTTRAMSASVMCTWVTALHMPSASLLAEYEPCIHVLIVRTGVCVVVGCMR